jgi:hypothetical protein
MAFTFELTILFSGICSFVTDQPLEGDAKPKELHPVLIDAWHTGKVSDYKGMDEKKALVRHGGILQIPSENVFGLQKPGGQVVWYPKRHHLDFTFTGSPVDLTIDSSVKAHVADMSKIASKFPHVGKSVVGGNPPQEVLANAVFKKGTLSAIPEERNWLFSDALKVEPGQHRVEKMAYILKLVLGNLTEVVMTAVPFTNLGTPRNGNPGSEEKAQLTVVGAKENDRVTIKIVNACDDNPLMWQVEGSEASDEDPDFKWHYEVLTEQRNEVKKALKDAGDKELPFPKQDGGPLGGGRNCFPAFWVI